MSVRVMVVDVHGITRAGVAALLGESDSFVVVAQAGDDSDALRLALDHRPQVIVLALGITGRDGIRLIETLRAQVPDARVLVLSMHEDDSLVRGALRAGACGYVPKRADASDLFDALCTVCRDELYVHSSVAGSLISHLDPGLARSVRVHTESLTARETEVLRYVALGYTNREIGVLMSVSARTVERHRASIMAKLDSQHRSDLVLYARERGLLD